MKEYKNLNNDSNIVAYDLDEDYVLIKFKDNTRYLYNVHHTGEENIKKLKELAIKGGGLEHFIVENLKKKHAKKFNFRNKK